MITMAVGSFVILIVVALVGFGAFSKFVIPPRELAYTVNGKTFDMSYYVKTMRWLAYNGQAATPDAMQANIVDGELLQEAASGLGISATQSEALDPWRQNYRSTLGQGQEFDESKFQTWFKARVKGSGLSEQDVTYFLEQSVLVNKLKDYLGKDIPATAPQVHLLGIEVSDALAASDVQSKLAQGQDFGELAKTTSINADSSASGGDLGWSIKDLLPTDFAGTVFNMEPGAITPAINGKITSNDSGGFWIFKVVEKQDAREVDQATQDALKSKLANQWFDDQIAKSKIDNMVTNEKRAWALSQVPAQ